METEHFLVVEGKFLKAPNLIHICPYCSKESECDFTEDLRNTHMNLTDTTLYHACYFCKGIWSEHLS